MKQKIIIMLQNKEIFIDISNLNEHGVTDTRNILYCNTFGHENPELISLLVKLMNHLADVFENVS